MANVPLEQKKRNKAIYERLASGEKPERIAVDFGISFARVYQIEKRYREKYILKKKK